MGSCIRKRVVYDMSCKCFQFFVNVEALYSRQSSANSCTDEVALEGRSLM